VIRIDHRIGSGGLALRIVEVPDHVGMQRALVALQRPNIVAVLIDDLLAMSRWQLSASTVTIVPLSEIISSSFGTAVISVDLASVAICASTGRCSQPRGLTICRGDLPLARSNERRRTLPSIATTP